MRHWKRLFYYLAINALVSACVMVAVLLIWDRTQSGSPLIGEVPLLSQNTPAAETGVPGSTPGEPGATLDGSPGPSATPITPSEIQEEGPEGAVAGEEYEVQDGDTLGEIAVRFDVTVAEIVAANDIENPDSLEVGQVLIIPVGEGAETDGSPDEEETSLPPDETPASTPTPTVEGPGGPGVGKVVIKNVVGVGDLASERVELTRTGSGDLSLQGWQLVEEGGQTFTFPQLTLFEAGAINLYTKGGQDTVIALYWGLDQASWEPGEKVTLLDQSGTVHATFMIP